MLRKFIIERGVQGVGSFDHGQMMGVARTSNEALAKLGPTIQWVESYVADNKTFCVYMATDESLVRQHAALSGFPADIITEVRMMIDPQTEHP